MHSSAILLLTLSLFLVGCEDDMSGDNLTNDDFISFSFDENVGLSEGASETMSVTVYAGSASNSDRTVGLYVDDSSTADAMSYSVASSVTIQCTSVPRTISITAFKHPPVHKYHCTPNTGTIDFKSAPDKSSCYHLNIQILLLIPTQPFTD